MNKSARERRIIYLDMEAQALRDEGDEYGAKLFHDAARNLEKWPETTESFRDIWGPNVVTQKVKR
jgi:hypothetical protein